MKPSPLPNHVLAATRRAPSPMYPAHRRYFWKAMSHIPMKRKLVPCRFQSRSLKDSEQSAKKWRRQWQKGLGLDPELPMPFPPPVSLDQPAEQTKSQLERYLSASPPQRVPPKCRSSFILPIA